MRTVEYAKRIAIPLNKTYAFMPHKELCVVAIRARYSGMILAQKLQHKYAEEMDQIVEHVIYEARQCRWNLGGKIPIPVSRVKCGAILVNSARGRSFVRIV
jgi:hypothetical protein